VYLSKLSDCWSLPRPALSLNLELSRKIEESGTTAILPRRMILLPNVASLLSFRARNRASLASVLIALQH
jgi:hypothetical protein